MRLQRVAGAESGRGIPTSVSAELRRVLQSLPTEQALQDTAMVELRMVYVKVGEQQRTAASIADVPTLPVAAISQLG